jgi:hypothetical protein
VSWIQKEGAAQRLTPCSTTPELRAQPATRGQLAVSSNSSHSVRESARRPAEIFRHLKKGKRKPFTPWVKQSKRLCEMTRLNAIRRKHGIEINAKDFAWVACCALHFSKEGVDSAWFGDWVRRGGVNYNGELSP